MKTSFRKSKKNLLALCLSVMMVTSGAAVFASCTGNTDSDSSSSSSSSSASTAVNDTSLVKNGGFETFNTNDGLNAIGTSVTGWTRSVNSTSSGSALTSRAASGIVDTSEAAWDKLTGTVNANAGDLSESEVEKIWDTLTVKDKLLYYKAWKENNKDGKIAEDLDFYEAYNIDEGDVPDCTNPGTHHKEGDEGYGEDTNVLMIHNQYPETDSSATYKALGTAQKYTSSSTVTVQAGTSVELSLWVKTADLMTSSTSGAPQKAVGKGAYINITHSVGSKSLPVYSVENINTEYMAEGSVAAGDYSNGWVKYSFYLKGSSYADTTFSLVLGLGQGGGENRGDYVNGYAFFDDIQCNVISNETYDEYETENTFNKTVYFGDTEDEKTVDVSDNSYSSWNKFALNFYGDFSDVALLDSLYGATEANVEKHIRPTSGKKGDQEYTSDAANNPLPELNGGLDGTSDVTKVFNGVADMADELDSNKYLKAVYNDYFADATFAKEDKILMLLSSKGVAYTADLARNNETGLGYNFTQEDFFDSNNNEYADYLALSFFVKTSEVDGFTGAGVTLKDGNNKTSFESLDTTDIVTVDVDDDNKDIYDGWQQCFFFVKNEFSNPADVNFSLSFTYGPTEIIGTKAESYYNGFAAFTGFRVYPMSKSEYDSVSAGTYAKVLSLTGNLSQEAAGNAGFDSAANTSRVSIEEGISALRNYKGVYSDNYYVNQTNGTTIATDGHHNAGLLNRDYFIGTDDEEGYYTNDATKAPVWMQGLTDVTGESTAEGVWNAMFGYNGGIGSRTQPLLIWNDGSNAGMSYGFIGNSTTLAANTYTKISVAVKVGAKEDVDTSALKAMIYLIDMDDQTYSSTLSIGRGLTYWYDDEGNICTGDPAEKATEVAFKLQSNGLYQANKNWSGYKKLTAEQQTAYFANLDAYTEKDGEGNLLVAEGGASHSYSVDNTAFYYNEATDSYFADSEKTVPVVNLKTVTKDSEADETKPLPYRYLAETNRQLVAEVGDTNGEWVSVSFYIHTGSEAKNYRLEVWSGERDGAGNIANSYVAFDMNYTGDAETNFTTYIDENKDNEDADQFENVFSYFDTDKFLRYNSKLDTDKTGNLYEDSYTPSTQASGVAYLAYTEDNEYRVLVDYQYNDVTVTPQEETEDSDTSNPTDDSSTESETNPWLFASSIAVAAVLVLAILSIVGRKLWEKYNKGAGKKARAPKEKKEKKVKEKKAKKVEEEKVDEDSPYND